MSAGDLVLLELGPPLPRGMPDPGVVLQSEGLPDAFGMRQWLAIAAPRFVVLDVGQGGADAGTLQRLHRLAGGLEAAAVLRVSRAGTGWPDYAALARAVADAKLRLERIVLSGAAGVDGELARARSTLEGIRVEVDGRGTGTSVVPPSVASADGSGPPEPDGQLRASKLLADYAHLARGGARGVALCAPGELVRGNSGHAGATPSFHVFAGLSRAAGTTRFAVAVSSPGAVEAIAHRVNGGLRVWLANRRAEPVCVRMNGLPTGAARFRVLEASSGPAAADADKSYDEAARPLDPARPIELAPHAVAVAEIALARDRRAVAS